MTDSPDAIASPPVDLRALAASEAAKVAPGLSIEERAQQLETEKRMRAERRATACMAEIQATCKRLECVLTTERAASVDDDGTVRFHARPVVAARP